MRPAPPAASAIPRRPRADAAQGRTAWRTARDVRDVAADSVNPARKSRCFWWASSCARTASISSGVWVARSVSGRGVRRGGAARPEARAARPLREGREAGRERRVREGRDLVEKREEDDGGDHARHGGDAEPRGPRDEPPDRKSVVEGT